MLDVSNYGGKLKRELKKINELPEDDPDKDEIILYADIITDNMKASSAFNRLGRIRRIKPVLNKPIQEIDEDDLRLALNRLAKKNMGEGEDYAASTKRKYLQTFYHFGKKRDIDQLENIDVPSVTLEPVDIETILTKEEVQDLIESADSPRDKALIAVCWEGAWRVSALLSLRVKDWETTNEEYGLLTAPNAIGNKGADGEKVPITFTRGYLQRWVSNHPTSEPEDALFCRCDREAKYGEHMSPEAARKRLQKAKANTEIEKPVHVHAFRHARATYMKMSDDYDDMHIEQVLGWAEGTQQHKRYEHLTQDQKVNSILRAQGIEADEDDLEPEKKNCAGCTQLVPYDARLCPYCGVRITDEPADWYDWYKKLTPSSDPIREQYDPVPSTTPTYSKLSKDVFEYVKAIFSVAGHSPDINDEERQAICNDHPHITEDYPLWETTPEDADKIHSKFITPIENRAENIRENRERYKIAPNDEGWSQEELDETVRKVFEEEDS